MSGSGVQRRTEKQLRIGEPGAGAGVSGAIEKHKLRARGCFPDDCYIHLEGGWQTSCVPGKLCRVKGKSESDPDSPGRDTGRNRWSPAGAWFFFTVSWRDNLAQRNCGQGAGYVQLAAHPKGSGVLVGAMTLRANPNRPSERHAEGSQRT